MIYVSSITLNKTRIVVQKDHEYILEATVLPENATNKNLKWTTTDSSIATVSNGVVTGKKAGSVYIEVDAMDGSFEGASCFVQVTNDVLVTKIDLDETVLNLSIDDGTTLLETVYPQNAANCRLHWSSSNYNVATVNPDSGFVTAQGAGTAVITARATDGSGVSAECEVWVKGKTPVFLIHGRTDNSSNVWGVRTYISPDTNDGYAPQLNARTSNNLSYIEQCPQSVIDTIPGNSNDKEKPKNLGYELENSGYKRNVNLFAFNYPNEDAVKHSAQKFEAYIKNLISYIREFGSDEAKACFYASRNDYNHNNYKINIVGHSMGGLVARYFIENMYYNGLDNERIYYDKHVDKLITICTPHWGRGYAEASCASGEILNFGIHKICDHDLRFDSKMYGGSFSTTLDCNALFGLNQCYTDDYELTDTLLYDRSRSTKYYAIAGIDYNAVSLELNDHAFEMPTYFTTKQEISDYFHSKNVFKYDYINHRIVEVPPTPRSVGDNMVGFLSQIGWVGDKITTLIPEPRIQMEKIYVDVDTDGGNGGEIFIWEVANGEGSKIFHSKVPHRIPVCNKVIEYLEDYNYEESISPPIMQL